MDIVCISNTSTAVGSYMVSFIQVLALQVLHA